MSHKNTPLLPRWAPRLPPGKIQRLYELDALGIQDDYLVDEVGYALQRYGQDPGIRWAALPARVD